MNDSYDIHFLWRKSVDDAISTFVDFPKTDLREFVNRVAAGRHERGLFDLCDQALNLSARVEFRITRDEMINSAEIGA